MSINKHRNFAESIIVVAPSPQMYGLSFTLRPGDGALFSPETFEGTCWPPGVDPTKQNAEIVRVERIEGDIVTLAARAQAETEAKLIAPGWQFADILTKGLIDEVNAELDARAELPQTFIQSTPAENWEFVHNLGRPPTGVTLYNEADEVFDANVVCTNTHITVTMDGGISIAGKVVLI